MPAKSAKTTSKKKQAVSKEKKTQTAKPAKSAKVSKSAKKTQAVKTTKPAKKTEPTKTTTPTTKTTEPKKPTTPKTTPKSMDDLLQDKTVNPPKKGDTVDAKIINLTKKGILFDIGWKSYAVLGSIEAQELGSYLPYLNEGDTVPVRIVVEEAKDGYPVVSMRSFFEKGKWDILEKKYESEEELEVVCGVYGKGGVFIEFMGIRGVIPKIQLTEEFIKNPEKLTHQKIKVKVLEVDREKNRLVVSQKASALGISYKDIKKKFNAIKIGDKHKAKVIGFSDFGVFCEINKIEGLVHISEISWQKVSDPKKFLEVGDDIDVIVVEKNTSNLKLNLSIKRLEKDPWEDVDKRYPKDKELKGTVIRKERYGYIVRLEPGVEGLVHISKLTGTDKLEVGKESTVYIEKIDKKHRRISLVLAREDKPVMYR